MSEVNHVLFYNGKLQHHMNEEYKGTVYVITYSTEFTSQVEEGHGFHDVGYETHTINDIEVGIMDGEEIYNVEFLKDQKIFDYISEKFHSSI